MSGGFGRHVAVTFPGTDRIGRSLFDRARIMTTAFQSLTTLEAPRGASQLPGSTYEAPVLEFGPPCGLPSPLECVAALEHAHRLVPGYPCDKLS